MDVSKTIAVWYAASHRDLPWRRPGEPCPVCGDTVRKVIYSDSTFQYFPTCQTGGKPLPDRVLSRLLK